MHAMAMVAESRDARVLKRLCGAHVLKGTTRKKKNSEEKTRSKGTRVAQDKLTLDGKWISKENVRPRARTEGTRALHGHIEFVVVVQEARSTRVDDDA